MYYRWNISSRFYSDSEANASELLKKDEIFPYDSRVWYMVPL